MAAKLVPATSNLNYIARIIEVAGTSFAWTGRDGRGSNLTGIHSCVLPINQRLKGTLTHTWVMDQALQGVRAQKAGGCKREPIAPALEPGALITASCAKSPLRWNAPDGAWRRPRSARAIVTYIAFHVIEACAPAPRSRGRARPRSCGSSCAASPGRVRP